MKKILLILLLLIPLNVKANPYQEKITLDGTNYITNCTWYVWNYVYTNLGISLPGWHNAKDWYNDAQL